MKVGICVRAIQTDGNSSTAYVLAETLLDAGHDVTLLSPVVGAAASGAAGRRWSFIDLGPTRWESDAALIRRLGRTFAEQRFDVLVVLTGLPIPRIEEAYRLLPDSTALLPAILGDREHVYEPAVRTARLWNVALTISPGLQREVERRVPGRPVRMLTHAIDFPDPALVANRTALEVPLRLISVGRLFGRKNVLVMPPVLAECRRRGLDARLTIVGEGPDRWKSMSSAGVERTRRVFSREVMAGELATLLEQIRAGRFATPAARRTAPRSRLGWRAHVPPALRRYTKRLPF